MTQRDATYISLIMLGSGIGMAAVLGTVAVLGGHWDSAFSIPMMLIPQAMTFFGMHRYVDRLRGEIDDLTGALHAREVLLDDHQAGDQVYANGVLVRTLNDIGKRIRVWTKATTYLELTVEDI